MFKYDYVSHKGLFLRDGLTRATHYTRAHTAPHPTQLEAHTSERCAPMRAPLAPPGAHTEAPTRPSPAAGAAGGAPAQGRTPTPKRKSASSRPSMTSPVIIRRGKIERERYYQRRTSSSGGVCLQVSRRYGLHGGRSFSVWPFASEGSESTLREADVLATVPMYDPGLLASCGRRRHGSVL